MNSDLGDYEQLFCQPYTEATHTTHGGYSGVLNAEHLSLVAVRQGPNYESWTFEGKWAHAGVYQTSLWNIHTWYGDAGDEFWRPHP